MLLVGLVITGARVGVVPIETASTTTLSNREVPPVPTVPPFKAFVERITKRR